MTRLHQHYRCRWLAKLHFNAMRGVLLYALIPCQSAVMLLSPPSRPLLSPYSYPYWSGCSCPASSQQIPGRQEPFITHRAPPFNRKLAQCRSPIAFQIFLQGLESFRLAFFLLDQECHLEDIAGVQRRWWAGRLIRSFVVPVQRCCFEW